MDMIYIAALLIGGTTLAGTACGFLLKDLSNLRNDAVTAFAAGVMLAAAMFGLFQPAMDAENAALTLSGAVCGMVFLRLAAALAPERRLRCHPELVFVLALVLHKFPEGMAGGVGLYGRSGMLAAWGVAIQNLPEGVIMIPPLIRSGLSRKKAACIALMTGLLNALGVIAGGLWGRSADDFLPFILAFAGGAMLDVIVKNMIPPLFQSKMRHPEWIIMGGFLLMTAVSTAFVG